MTKPALMIMLASLLSGCVTSNDNYYSQTATRGVTAPQPPQAAVRSNKVQDKAGLPVVLGTAY